MNDEFPTRLQLWRGAMLMTIAHAIWVTSKPFLAYELSWDGKNYNRQDSQGSRGAITFEKNVIVGVFQDIHSPRFPFQSDNYAWQAYFRDAPEHIIAVAQQEAVQYVIDKYKGKEVPVITSAFWGEDDIITAGVAWYSVFTNGAHLVRIECMETELALPELQQNFEFSDAQIGLLVSLFNRKVTMPNALLTLEDSEFAILTASGRNGLSEGRELLEAICIILP